MESRELLLATEAIAYIASHSNHPYNSNALYKKYVFEIQNLIAICLTETSSSINPICVLPELLKENNLELKESKSINKKE